MIKEGKGQKRMKRIISQLQTLSIPETLKTLISLVNLLKKALGK